MDPAATTTSSCYRAWSRVCGGQGPVGVADRQAVCGPLPINLVTSPGEQEESRCQRCISELKDIRLQLEACETRIVHRLRLPLDKDPARECAQRIAEQQAGVVLHSTPLLSIPANLALRGSWLSDPLVTGPLPGLSTESAG